MQLFLLIYSSHYQQFINKETLVNYHKEKYNMEQFYNSSWFIIGYWIVALIASILASAFAFKIHNATKTTGASLVHQYILNFLGACIGWILLWIILPDLVNSISRQSSTSFTFKDVLILILAFIGIMGYLPVALVGLAFSFKEGLLKIFK